MVMSKDKGSPDNLSSSDELSENDPSHLQKNTYIVIDSTGDSDDELGNDVQTSEMIELDFVVNDKSGNQFEISPGLNCDKETMKDLKCPGRENVNINGFSESSPCRDKTFPVKYFENKSQGASEKVLKDCVVNCSMTEEEVEYRKKMCKSCEKTQPFGKNINDSNYKKTEQIIIESKLNEISSFTYDEAHANQNCNSRNCYNELNDTKANKIFFSTPLKKGENLENSFTRQTVFEEISPLVQPFLKTKNLKRKNLKLESIQETDEDSCDSSSKKKIKFDNKNEFENKIIDSTVKVVDDISFMSDYEAPAKSILKKWQPSYICRNSSSSSNVDDEVAGLEDDDFEIACKSLTEELIKSSMNIDELGKVSQMDNDKFDEIWRELHEELDDKTSLSLKTMEESVLSERHTTVLSVKSMALNDTNDETLKNGNSSNSSLNNTVVDKGLEIYPIKELSTDVKVLPREPTTSEKEDNKERSVTLITKSKQNSDSCSPGLIENTAQKSPENPIESSDQVDKNDLEVDEEELLLEGDKNKPYHYVEYASEDPRENEDNYNPEWQKLGRLTNDEERYKAVRDRWRSLVPPDPNKDLTLSQWRERNKLPPISLNLVNNNNYQMIEDKKRTKQCTAVFEMKIDSITAELEKTRKRILSQRHAEFEQLAKKQDEEQIRFIMSGRNNMLFAILHKKQLEHCRHLKDKYDNDIRMLMTKAERKIKLLQERCNEIMMFQKFYKGVGHNGNDGDMMTIMQVEELLEMERMVEAYESLYPNKD